jgi:hypothetical protein
VKRRWLMMEFFRLSGELPRSQRAGVMGEMGGKVKLERDALGGARGLSPSNAALANTRDELSP